MGIRVTVVIPAFNATKTIHDGLDAFARQSFPAEEVELIIVDDESTDGTPEYIERYVKDWGSAHPGVRVLRQAHRGPAAARNLGAEAAQGEFLLFTDADCVPHIDWIKEMMAPFQSPGIAAVKGAYRTKQRSLVARFAQAEFEADIANSLRRNMSMWSFPTRLGSVGKCFAPSAGSIPVSPSPITKTPICRIGSPRPAIRSSSIRPRLSIINTPQH